MQRSNHGDNLPAHGYGSGSQPPPPGFPGAPARVQNFPGGFAPSPFAVANPHAPPTASGRYLPTIAELFSAFKRRWVLSLLVGGLLGAMLAAAVWMALPSGKHQVRAVIQFKSSTTNVGKNDNPTELEFDRWVEGEMKRMKMKPFLAKVAADPAVRQLPMIADADDKAAVIEGLLNTKRDPAEWVNVTMNGDDSTPLLIIMSAFVKEYLNSAQGEEKSAHTQRITLLTEAIAELDKKIAERRKVVNDQAALGGGTENTTARLLLEQELQKLSDKVFNLEQEVATAKVKRGQLETEQKTGKIAVDPTEVNAAVVNSAGVMALQLKLTQAQETYNSVSKKAKEGSPALTEAEVALAAAKVALESAVANARQVEEERLKTQRRLSLSSLIKQWDGTIELNQKLYDGAKKSKENLEANLKDMKKGSVLLAPEMTELQMLQENKSKLSSELSTLSVGQAMSRIESREPPQAYPNYNLKQKMAFAVGAALAGLLAVIVLIAYLEWRNRRVDGVDQVVTELGMRVIGTIPAFPSRAALRSGDGSNQNWRFILNESVNSTRTMLLHTAKSQQMQVILVTSAMQGEGKTSLSSQLATSMATAGLRTLILDCDLRNPSMQKLFDIPVAPGCAEVLLQEIDISDAIQPTTVPNLWIIPAGQCNHRVIAALAQGHPLEALFNRLRGQFDIVVVDSCPILPVADTLLVAQYVDGVVFSILQDVSQLPKVQDASERLVQLNIPLLGAVVNGIKPDTQAYGYNYVKQLPA